MSAIRRHCVIVLDGTKHEVTTSARDLAAVERDNKLTAEDEPIMFTMAVVHKALLRLRAPDVPTEFDDYLDLIDEFIDLEDEGTDGNPTRAEA